MFIPENIKYVLCTLEANGFEAYLVGGCVRDSVMGIIPKDYDITTNALPEQILHCFEQCKTLTNGIKHGTVSVIVEKELVEVTTYRIDGEYNDSRHPECVTFSRNLTDDLSRRDFTVNAICVSNDGMYVDLFGGKNDIDNKLIRCVGEPEKRFCEDALRIMRALRFSSVLDFEIEGQTSKAIFQCAHLLANISAERIFTELKKLLCGVRANKIIEEYADVFKIILPQLELLDKNDFLRVSSTLSNCSERLDDDVLGLCCFFSEFAKSDNASDIVRSCLLSLKSSNAILKAVTAVCSRRDVVMPTDNVFCRRLVMELGYDNAFTYLKLFAAKNETQKNACECVHNTLLNMQIIGECVSLSGLEISGKDIINGNIASGELVGKILNMLLELVVTQAVDNDKELLLQCAKQLAKEGNL